MTTTEMVVEISKNTGLPKREVALVLRSFVATSKKALMSGERVTLREFGAFYTIVPKERALFGGKSAHSGRRIIRFKEARPWKSMASKSTPRR
jgi:nucleoid DNA-binding protein